jgi:hypothetical protein
MKTQTKEIEPLCTASTIALVTLLGSAGGIGKSTIANAFASFFEAAGIPVRMVRVETGVRKAEFAASDIVIDLDAASEAATAVGGEASLFDAAWSTIKWAIGGNGVVVIDGGANSHRTILGMAGTTGLAARAAAKDATTLVVVVTTPDPEAARQAAALVRDVETRMPEAKTMIAVNYLNAAERPGADTPQARAFTAHMKPLASIPRLTVPHAGGQALQAFAECGRGFLEIMRANETYLMRWTGKSEPAALGAQAYLGAWWNAVTRQLSQYFPHDAQE